MFPHNIDKLIKFQQHFAASVTQNLKYPDLLESIVPAGTLISEQVLEVYESDYRFRLLQTLGDRYETVWMILGDEEFRRLAFLYIASNPSNVRDLSSYGLDFVNFLEEEFPAPENKLILELARLEFHFWRFFHQAPVIAGRFGKKLQQLPDQESLFDQTFSCHESMYLFQSSYDLWKLFGLRKNGLNNMALDDFAQSTNGILYKQHEKVCCKYLSSAQWSFLLKLQEGCTISEAFDAIPLLDEANTQELFAFLAGI